MDRLDNALLAAHVLLVIIALVSVVVPHLEVVHRVHLRLACIWNVISRLYHALVVRHVQLDSIIPMCVMADFWEFVQRVHRALLGNIAQGAVVRRLGHVPRVKCVLMVSGKMDVLGQIQDFVMFVQTVKI